MPIYAQKNTRYAHFTETCEKCGNKRNMQQSHIRTKLTCLVRAGWRLEFRVRLALGSVTGGRCVGGGQNCRTFRAAPMACSKRSFGASGLRLQCRLHSASHGLPVPAATDSNYQRVIRPVDTYTFYVQCARLPRNVPRTRR